MNNTSSSLSSLCPIISLVLVSMAPKSSKKRAAAAAGAAGSDVKGNAKADTKPAKKKVKVEFPRLPASSPTADELKKWAHKALDEKAFYYVIIHHYQFHYTIYNNVPGTVLKPYWNDLTGLYHRISLDRERAYLAHHPNFKTESDSHVCNFASQIPEARDGIDTDKFHSDLKPYCVRNSIGTAEAQPEGQILLLGLLNWDR